ncbi:MAG: hypothetical protein IPH31_05375 [Lewinellaceae bacterium]|nr:hypothetical protein [Lewinellaceae bacterium]
MPSAAYVSYGQVLAANDKLNNVLIFSTLALHLIALGHKTQKRRWAWNFGVCKREDLAVENNYVTLKNNMQLTKKSSFWLTVCTSIILCSSAQAQHKVKTYRHIPLLQLQDTVFHCTVIGKEVYLDGDIHLGDTTELNRLQQLAFALVIDDNWLMQTRWPNSLVPVEIDNNFQVTEKNTIIESLNEMMAVTNIAFKIRSTETDYVSYRKSSLNLGAGSSPVGRKGKKQEIIISTMSKSVVKHETLQSGIFMSVRSAG